VALDPSYAGPLRRGDPSVVGRTLRDRLLLDLRCVPDVDDERLFAAVLGCRW
jgi:L-seryl-tRNA(Ser) seleniumtransferase